MTETATKRKTAQVLHQEPTGYSALPAGAHVDDATVTAIKASALRAFYRHGYHGTSVRDIANGGGMSVAGLYHHFRSKVDILFELISGVMDDLIRETEAALTGAGDHPADQLQAIVTAHVLFHTHRYEESFVGNTELRSFDNERRRAIIAMRDHQQSLFDVVVSRGAERGVFATPYPVEASRAIVTMSTAVATWYRSDGPLSPEQIAERYSVLALNAVDYRTGRADGGSGQTTTNGGDR